MGRPRKKPVYLITSDSVLGCIGEDRIVNLDAEPENDLLNELQCPAADETLIALRKSFSLTYPRNPFLEGLQQALSEIRRIGTEALKDIPDVLRDLQLKPINAEPEVGKVHLFLFSFARVADLKIQVKYEGKRYSLLKLLDHLPADDLIRCLRQTVSDTFSEMHSEDEHEDVLRQIRKRIWTVLPPYNALLDQIEIERIAEMPPEKEESDHPV